MKIVHEPSQIRLAPSAVTIGVFDGVHRGHQTVLTQLARLAQPLDLKTVVVTFDHHPAQILRPAQAPALLCDLEQRLERLEECGVDTTWVVRFDQTRSEESAEAFIQDTLIDRIHTKLVVVGEDFHFGRRRQGSVGMLIDRGAHYGFEVRGLELVGVAGAPERPEAQVSSTAIRRALFEGRLSDANIMLGRPHELRGPVVHGDQRGRTLGFPTANVAISPVMCLPAHGVFAGHLVRPNGERLDAAIYVGSRPTFYDGDAKVVVEAHCLGFSGDLYGELVGVQFTHRIRGEQTFNGPHEIAAQLRVDSQEAMCLLS